MFKVFASTTIKKGDRLMGIPDKTVELVRRNVQGTHDCLSVTMNRKLIVQNFKLDQEWEAETIYSKTVQELKAQYN